MSLAGDRLQRMTAIDTVGLAPAAPIDQVVLTIASVEPLVSDLFLVTLTPAVPAYLARVGPTTPTRARRPFDASVDPTDARKATELAGDPILGAAVANSLDVESRSDAVV